MGRLKFLMGGEKLEKLFFIYGLTVVFFTFALFAYLFDVISPPAPAVFNRGPLIVRSATNSTQAPQPFAQMTVPYLRNRQYQSKLGELKKYEDHPNYTSYLTSYDSDGLMINGLLTIPKGEVPEGGWPAIVFVHGYIPPSLYQTTQRYVAYVDYLARNGYVVFKIDLRGHGNSQGEASGAYYSGDYIIDTLNAYSALQEADFVNGGKVGLWGHSMAGNIVFRSFVAKRDIPAVAIWAGAGYTYTDLRTYRIMDTSYRPPEPETHRATSRQLLFDTYGDFSEDSPFWKQVVPTNYLDGVSGAIMIDHALNDDVVSIDYSRNLMKILDKTSIPHTLNEFPTGGHNISGASFIPAMQKTVEFFNKYLKQ
jgi:dipeptidyl aminopeptidase/acylaminoacyl peptidase